jgi:predicted RNA-binding Zn-ribbon protein involved in translation (DUF1610 family)
MTMMVIRGLTHDYNYYPEDFTGSDGRVYHRGYYDENGQYYQNVGVENETVELECPYCGTRAKIKWKEGMLPKCEACGGEYDIHTDKAAPTQQVSGNPYGTPGAGAQNNSAGGKILRFAAIAAVVVIGLAILGVFSGSKDKGSSEVVQQVGGDTLYVDAIGRDCVWDEEIGSWYDDESQCWFEFNRDLNPAQWQYWYENISSDYGDYGWMEYDDKEKQWYIETDAGNWEKLPSTYNTSKLWHMKDAYRE